MQKSVGAVIGQEAVEEVKVVGCEPTIESGANALQERVGITSNPRCR